MSSNPGPSASPLQHLSPVLGIINPAEGSTALAEATLNTSESDAGVNMLPPSLFCYAAWR
jgi:hypothetical protein